MSSPYLQGNDVLIMQNLIIRDGAVDDSLTLDGIYGPGSADAVSQFQGANDLSETGIFDDETASKLLDLHSADGVKDSGFTAASMGYMYKLHVPVYYNRSIETQATLFDANNKELMTFTVRSHGHRDDGSSAAWPDMGNGDVGLNEFTSNGNTITGIWEIDLNSPEPDPATYGPWPVNRFVRGIEGNCQFMTPYIRDGQLLHTGNWTSAEGGWNPTMTMPDSAGCLHGHPSDVEKVYQTLVDLGVKVNDNTFSGKDYPYKPQGIAVIELISDA